MSLISSEKFIKRIKYPVIDVRDLNRKMFLSNIYQKYMLKNSFLVQYNPINKMYILVKLKMRGFDLYKEYYSTYIHYNKWS